MLSLISPEYVAFYLSLILLVLGTVLFSAIESPNGGICNDKKISYHFNSQCIVRFPLNVTVSQEGKLFLFADFRQLESTQRIKQIALEVGNLSAIFVIYEPLQDTWSFDGALFFSITALTTIGYGTLHPTTSMGKVALVTFATIGIPLHSIVIQNIKNFFLKISLVVGTKLTTLSFNSTRDNRKGFTYFILTILSTALLGVIPSLVFVQMEGWDLLSALYYNFVSLSTIGFGDMIAGINRSSSSAYSDYWIAVLYRIFLTSWLFFGLPFASSFFDLIQALLECLCTRLSLLMKNVLNR